MSSSVRILHSADWQIGLRAAHVARVGDLVRKARFEAARAVVAYANNERVDALILAGDIFEDNQVDNSLVYEVVRILSASQVPVYVLPGNHDPLSQDSIYRRTSWRERPGHVHLLENHQPIPIAHGSALLLPAPLSLKKSELDPTDELQLPVAGAGGPLIGVAHGSLRIEGKYGRDDFPIALDAAQKKGLSYLALGHWHGRYIHGDRTAYSGTLETTKFGEENSGLSLIVEFESALGAPKIREFRSGRLLWLSRELDLSAGHAPELDIQRLKQELSAYSQAANQTLLRVRTRGECTPEAHLALQALEEEFSSRFVYFELDRKDLPSSVVQGRLASWLERYPFAGALFESLQKGTLDADLAQAGDVEITAAKRILGELLLKETEGASLP